MKYVLSIDQSTQGTKALLLDEEGKIIKRADLKHAQLINELGYVSHNPLEIYDNTVKVIKKVIEEAQINKKDVTCIGISNQRETTLMWDKDGKPYADAVVWQCSRAKDIAERYVDKANLIYKISGLPLSPYFPACKMKWLAENVEHGECLYGTVDSWLIYKLTKGKSFKTDTTNASRTQLYDLEKGEWSKELCELFDINIESLPEICDCDDLFGYTDVEGYFEKAVPITGVMGDSHAALFGQGCHNRGQVKVTLGTGSSIMMNIGEKLKLSKNGLTTSIAYSRKGVRNFAFEGNINYAGAVITWLEEIGLIESVKDLEGMIEKASATDETILVPAFSGLSAPYWKNDARAMFYGMSRTTGSNELVKATVDSIAYQITDILHAMASDSSINIAQVKADGGPSRNKYLMQFLSETARTNVSVSEKEELSAIGAACMAGISFGVYDENRLFANQKYTNYTYQMKVADWAKIMQRWYHALNVVLNDK